MSKQKPAVHEGNAFNRNFIAMTLPLFAMGVFFYGPRVITLALLAVITARIADRLAAMMRRRRYDATENSSTTMALIIVLMMPASVQFRVVIMAVLAAILVGKEAFGGYNAYPFNPVSVGYCVAAIAWPQQMFRYPEPINWMRISDWSFENLFGIFRFQGAQLVSGPSLTLKNGGLPAIDTLDLVLGNYAGPLGATCSVVIIACALFLIARKCMPLAAPLTFIATIAIITFLFPRAPEGAWQVLPWFNFAQRLETMKYEVFSGALLFAAVFLIDDPGTLPKNTVSRVIYGALLGFATVMFRYFGTYELGTCFAFLLVNAVSGYFDRAVAARAAKASRPASPAAATASKSNPDPASKPTSKPASKPTSKPASKPAAKPAPKPTRPAATGTPAATAKPKQQPPPAKAKPAAAAPADSPAPMSVPAPARRTAAPPAVPRATVVPRKEVDDK